MTDYNFFDYGADKLKSKFSYDVLDKEASVFSENLYKIDELSNVFEWQGLPVTIPQRALERQLQLHGSALFTEINGKYYTVIGGAGGEFNEYREPTIYSFANPYLNISGNYRILNNTITDNNQPNNGEGVLIRNDNTMQGILPLLNKFNGLQADIDITIYRAIIDLRAQALASAATPKEFKAIEAWYKSLEQGKPTAVFDKAFADGVGGIKIQPIVQAVSASGYISSLIEMRQYLSSTLNNRLGINANFNMKREALSTAECSLNDESIIPLILDMFKRRLEACADIEKFYGLKIRVKLTNLWAQNVEAPETEAEHETDDNRRKEENETDDTRDTDTESDVAVDS